MNTFIFEVTNNVNSLYKEFLHV